MSLVAGGTASTALVLAGQSERARSAYCYSETSLTSEQEQVSLPPEIIDGVGDDEVVRAAKRAAMAEDLCGALWRAGVFSETGTSANPDLAICEADDGVLAALPKFDGVTDSRLCEEMGLLALVR
ncbi:hypothetical protein [Microbacterium dauci]|uniref:Uncharacterized protein n=1 Tax=Microbacterium dauci TaxID=3048008 RepID=A0ABT6ZDH7_9MICO|nr:hypothetical protein [Microbacterium sp. LX3-4]MDJ1114198.1 hypothetical protein [Microbacterium sp. LX3-4]